MICIGFLGGVLALRWTQAETVWYLVLGGAAAVVGIVSLALELVSRWKKRQSGTETGSYGKAAGNPETRRNRRCIFGISESEGLKTERWNMESAKRYRTAGMEKGFLSRKRKHGKRMKNRKTEKMHSLMELEGHEEDLFGKNGTADQPGG